MSQRVPFTIVRVAIPVGVSNVESPHPAFAEVNLIEMENPDYQNRKLSVKCVNENWPLPAQEGGQVVDIFVPSSSLPFFLANRGKIVNVEYNSEGKILLIHY